MNVNNGQLVHIIYNYGNSDKQFALFLGKAITVFGQPDFMDTDYENMYSYLIVAENEEDKLYLEIYHDQVVRQ